MGDVGNFLLGGSKSSQGSNQQSSSTSGSSNASQQGSISSSNNQSNSHASSGNQAYAPIAGAMSPTLGYTAAGGDMLGALLGLPGYSPTSAPSPAVAPTALPVNPTGGTGTGTRVGRGGRVIPPAGGGSGGGTDIPGMISMLQNMFKTTPAPKPPTSPVPVTPTPGGGYSIGGTATDHTPIMADRREMGGPVAAGNPYVVGEKRPELFVPQTSGTIVPQVPKSGGGGMIDSLFRGRHGGPGSPPIVPPVVPPVTPPVGTPPPGTTPPPAVPPVQPQNALDTWANSAGMNFLRDQGTQAIANTGAGSGTFQSGATGKALEKFGVGLGSTYQNDYINHLLDFAKLGLGGASAMSGAGGVSNSNSNSSGSSGSVSMGNSAGSSTGNSNSTGTSSGSGNSKKGLVPDILGG